MDARRKSFTPRLRSALYGSTAAAALALASSLTAATLDALTPKDAATGLRAALSQGVDLAVAQLGATGGFLNDPQVTIALPPALEKVDRALRLIGMSADAEQLKAAMNHAAEAAVAQARPVFRLALQRMSVTDAKEILSGGDDAGTQYFRRAASSQLSGKFKPLIAQQTARLQLASLYGAYAGKAAQLGLIDPDAASLDDYVTSRALDGLFSRIAQEEYTIRHNPLGQASSLIRRVFGSL